jgi:hypothetical protein
MKFNKINDAVAAINATVRGAKVCPFTQNEFFIGQGIMIAAAGYNCKGCELWSKDNEDVGVTANPKTWVSVTLLFVATKNAGSTKKGNPYNMKYTDDWGNVHVHEVDRPDIISNFFEHSNMIDKHNQL